ncbi:MAG TPA: DHH family phosphoesterase [Candidatus Acidoferrales bacterium]|nr:DHH family phosphoesterase [Candidatus Acidoferrales bacterium]
MKVRVFFHGKCFDGTCSAALFSRFYRERIREDALFEFTGLVHRAGALFDENQFDGDENVIVDFKYSASPRITWWFDHHQSAFLTPEDADHYRTHDQSRKFYDPEFKSCTKFLAQVAQDKFGFDAAPVAELIHWADIIDGAQFESPEQAVEMAEPAMKLTMAIESTNDPDFLPRVIPFLVSEPLASVIQEPFVAELIPPLMERHGKSLDIIRQHSECKNGTIYFDISDYDLEGYNKFIPYYLHRDSVYSVGLSRSSFRVKVAVGSNPWTRKTDMVNLAKICERYGGGGHARVGAISFPPDRAELARKAAQEIVQELRNSD